MRNSQPANTLSQAGPAPAFSSSKIPSDYLSSFEMINDTVRQSNDNTTIHNNNDQYHNLPPNHYNYDYLHHLLRWQEIFSYIIIYNNCFPFKIVLNVMTG